MPAVPPVAAQLWRRLGWRAVAIPVLAVATVVVVLDPGGGPAAPAAAGTPGGTPAAAAGGSGSAEALSAPQTLAAQPVDGDSSACAGNTRAQFIRVSISAQHAWACDAGQLVLSSPVTTGADVPDRETRVGSWTVQAKQENRDLVGPGYSEHVDYWIPYDGDFGLHDATWQTFAFGTAGWRTDGSHGCVHFPLDAMAWVYGWIQVGTTVTIDA